MDRRKRLDVQLRQIDGLYQEVADGDLSNLENWKNVTETVLLAVLGDSSQNCKKFQDLSWRSNSSASFGAPRDRAGEKARDMKTRGLNALTSSRAILQAALVEIDMETLAASESEESSAIRP